MKVGVVIVWYNPTQDQVNNTFKLSNIDDLKVCVVDNSKEKYVDARLESKLETISYVHNGNEGGIAGAFNRGIESFLEDESISLYFTMDQDSDFQSSYYQEMSAFMVKNNAAIACPNFYDRNSKTYGTFVSLTPYFYKIVKDGTSVFCISSGMGISAEAWKDVGPFDEDLIIDHVDTDFCLKAYSKRIEIKVNYEQCLNHAIGEREKHYFLGVCFKPNHHSYVRKYYIVRNGTYLAFKYFGITKGYFNLNILRVIHEVACVVLYEKDKLRKLRFMAQGLIDGLRGKLGAIK